MDVMIMIEMCVYVNYSFSFLFYVYLCQQEDPRVGRIRNETSFPTVC